MRKIFKNMLLHSTEYPQALFVRAKFLTISYRDLHRIELRFSNLINVLFVNSPSN